MARVLIVDDDEVNRSLLMACLEGSGHHLQQAGSGIEALALAEAMMPDLVLLDVMMPGIDGIETTRRLKKLAGGSFLPIILITARTDRDSKLIGLSAGADEFLPKPIDRPELLLRVRNLLRLRENEVALTQQNTQHAELHRFKDELSAMIVHDLKNPLAAVISNLEFALTGTDTFQNDTRESIDEAKVASRRALRIIESLLDVTRIEAGRLDLRRRPTNVSELLGTVVNQRTLLTRARDIQVNCRGDNQQRIDVDSDLILRVIENLFDNSVRYTPSGGRIELCSTADDEHACIRVGNTGPPIPQEFRRVIFEKYGQVAPTGRTNLGLGLYFCRLATEAHGGRIWVEDTPDFPTVFGLEFPMAKA